MMRYLLRMRYVTIQDKGNTEHILFTHKLEAASGMKMPFAASIVYLSKPTLIDVAQETNHEEEYWIYEVGLHHHRNMR